MTRWTATEVANSWYELAQGHEELGDAYQRLVALLHETLPDNTEAAAGARVDGQPAVVALAGDGFFLTTFAHREGEGFPQPVIGRLPLAPEQPALRIRDRWREDASVRAPRGWAIHVREWTVTWPDGRVVSFESVVRGSAGLHPGPDDAEKFGRALAARLGWTLPQ